MAKIETEADAWGAAQEAMDRLQEHNQKAWEIIDLLTSRNEALTKALQEIADWPFPYLSGSGIKEARAIARKALTEEQEEKQC